MDKASELLTSSVQKNPDALFVERSTNSLIPVLILKLDKILKRMWQNVDD